MREMISCKNFSNQVWKLISKRQVKFCGGCYYRQCQQKIITSISNINEQRQYKNDCLKGWEKCRIVNNFLMESHRVSLCFVVKSLVHWSMCFPCPFVVLKSRDVWYSYFWQHILIKLQHAKFKVYHFWKIKNVLIAKLTQLLLKDMMTNTRSPNNFSSLYTEFLNHFIELSFISMHIDM